MGLGLAQDLRKGRRPQAIYITMLVLKPGSSRMRQYKVWVSIFILLVIALHAVPALSPVLKKRVWPFLDWGMYKDSRPPGPIQANKKRIIGVTLKGQKEAVTPFLLGSSRFAFQALYATPMWRRDSSAARQLFTRLNLQREDPFVELRLESETYTVTDTGVVKQDNPVVTYRSGPSPSR
jgi:hypothetical protein